MNRKLIGAEWQRALSSLSASRALLHTGHTEDGITRSYYSIFHAAKAALAVPEVETSTHAGVRSMFGLHLVKTGEIEAHWANELSESLDDRIRADYDTFTHFTSEDARDEHERAAAFLRRIRRYLLTKGLSEDEISAIPEQ